MSILGTLLLRVRKADSPFFARIKSLIQWFFTFDVPNPRLLRPFWGFLYHLRQLLPDIGRRLLSICYRQLLFKSQCHSVGKKLQLEQIPNIYGQPLIRIGDNVYISGRIRIGAGRAIDQPELTIGDNVFVGHEVYFSVHNRIVVEEGVLLAGGVCIMDNNSHPMDFLDRIRGLPPPLAETAPVHIGRYAWIGRNSCITKGVTIGEGAIVGMESVVTADVPAWAVAAGSPARIIRQGNPPENWTSTSRP